ncbi:unnamed protein product [Gadus morhua 'NCC']
MFGVLVKARVRVDFSYAELIADWPVVVLGVCTVLIVICALIGVLVPDLPDFSDPLLAWPSFSRTGPSSASQGRVDEWISEELLSAPAGLRHGWFISNLEFYDLQDSLSGGTLIAMALSVGVAFGVMLLTT